MTPLQKNRDKRQSQYKDILQSKNRINETDIYSIKNHFSRKNFRVINKILPEKKVVMTADSQHFKILDKSFYQQKHKGVSSDIISGISNEALKT